MTEYSTSERTRQKKDAKRTAMMNAAVRVFAQKGYHAATVRDIVRDAEVAIGTFYFYFPDKETLFVHLYEETADFLLQAMEQAINSRADLPHQLLKGIQAYVNIALYEPAVIQLLLVGGVGAAPSLAERRLEFRERLVKMWQRPLATALSQGIIPTQNVRRVAEGYAGAFDEMVLNLLAYPEPEREAETAVQEMALFALRAVAYAGN
ncbi:MAG: TetR/AcrR family transcriptional regulator [Chloroflexi bacterium]|nr:TetR/AcrR family transcriptional regulator [Ardenticatenaceae bacterium]MBL1127031.1 TetR/AcrR family transcriptional regulator [Chloroflexota bacterium]NOG33092.1 TetR/AcrR family transcriptional regulator [Chloroflexota bacterium]GIK54611.1 MAG: TetR family transcriptional regulator [Chloroflexota bacterium]